jgi:hypothetical protein
MNTNFKEEYKKWIEKLSKQNFDELILNYAKEYYETRTVYISDGPYDGGIDLIYSIEDKEYKRNIQITVQQVNYESKLESDLKKSKENVDEYNYLNTLDFYISQSISPEKKKKLIKDAEIHFQITLKIIDANELSGLAQEYKSIRQTIQKFNKAAFPDENLNIDKNTKILFDTISIGKDITDIKNNFIEAIILTFLYEKKSATVEEIFKGLKETFYKKYNKNFFETEIGKLKSTSKIETILDTNPKVFKLTANTLSTIQQIEQMAQMHENELIANFKSILARYHLENEAANILKFLIDLYNVNYEIDESEILNEGNNHNKKIQKIFSNLIAHLQKHHNIDLYLSNEISRQLLVICSKNEFLNKTSVSKMFINLFKSDKLDTYLSRAERKVYLDTQILLQIICCNYDSIEYEDQLYKAIKYFNNTVETSSVPISLQTTIGYVEEVAWHILNGIKLERFLELDFIKDLGPSKNVFFNFYLELKKQNYSEFETFSEFIEEMLDVNTASNSDGSLVEDLIQSLVERLELLGIEVKTPPIFDNYEKYRKEYEISLSYMKHDQKSYEARKNDLNTILFLSGMHFDLEEGLFTEPFFITWDISFHEVRKNFKKFKELNYWYLYPPMKFANTVSVLNMKVDSQAINFNVIALVEDNFNLSNETISFLDIVNGLFNDKDIKKWKIINKLAKLRKRLIEDLNVEDFNKGKSKNIPIDEMLLLIQKYYQNPENKRNFKDLTNLFQNNDYADKLTDLIEKKLTNYESKNKISQDIIDNIDLMIKENNEAQNML